MGSPDPAVAHAEHVESDALRALQPAVEADVAVASAPGRCTLLGEHVDYAGGFVLCTAIDRYVGVAGRRAAREHGPAYALAAGTALRRRGLTLRPFEAATAASLPQGAGLSSSAAVICATMIALLRLEQQAMSARELIATAYVAEHDVLGVPCGRMDQHAIVESRGSAALLYDALRDTSSSVRWALDGVVLCACDSGERHSVAGAAYRSRRTELERALSIAGARNVQDLEAVDVLALESQLGAVLTRRLRHAVTESRRSLAGARALEENDARALGELMTTSHRSLRDDYEVSTAVLDAVVAAATATPGCHGARLVGAGFGGTVVALTDAVAAAVCLEAMAAAAPACAGVWQLGPVAGVAATAADVVVADYTRA